MTAKHKTRVTIRAKALLKSKIVRWIGLLGAISSVIAVSFLFYELIYAKNTKPTHIFKVDKEILSKSGVKSEVGFPTLERLKDEVHPTSIEWLKVYIKSKDEYTLDKVSELEKRQLKIVSLVLFLKGVHKLKSSDLNTAVDNFSASLLHDPQNILSLSYLHHTIEKRISTWIINGGYPTKREWERIKQEHIFLKEIEEKINSIKIAHISSLYIARSNASYINIGIVSSYRRTDRYSMSVSDLNGLQNIMNDKCSPLHTTNFLLKAAFPERMASSSKTNKQNILTKEDIVCNKETK